MNRINIVAALVLASVQLQRGGGLATARLITCHDGGKLKAGGSGTGTYTAHKNNKPGYKCAVAKALNEKIKNETDGTISCYGGAYSGVVLVVREANNGKCDEVAKALNEKINETDGTILCSGEYLMVPGAQNQCPQSPCPTKCEAVTKKLTSLIADIVERATFKHFYYATGSLTGVTFIGSGYYAHEYLNSDKAWRTLLFALFAALRVFDWFSDWGMFSITLASQHEKTPLRYASLAFSIIGSLLMVVDLSTMLKRAKHWFGVEDLDSESATSVGCGMLAVVLLEDLPQMVIAIAYFVDIGADANRAVDPIAITSLVLSGMSLLANAFIAVKSLCCQY